MWTSPPRIARDPHDEAPFVVRFGRLGAALPYRRLVPSPAPRLGPTQLAPSWIDTGPTDKPFALNDFLTRLTRDIAARTPELAHLDADRILWGYTTARSASSYGLQARCTPLRFDGGRMEKVHRGTTYRIQRYFIDGREMMYIVTFCLPRFLDRSFDDKLITLIHELYHVAETFNGDLRRHPGRCAYHTASHKAYDKLMADMARDYLASGPPALAYEFLRLSFPQLCARHGSVLACRIPRPKLLPVRA